MQLLLRSLKPEEKSFGVGIHALAARVLGKTYFKYIMSTSMVRIRDDIHNMNPLLCDKNLLSC